MYTVDIFPLAQTNLKDKCALLIGRYPGRQESDIKL